ncbi:hypothetical protein [Streptomyces sp. AA0539]|uniref:hypothetical protein n=1 Tax=Streptomyces sp. AA0539 TaxID=1210045 RepID=UPI0002F47B59|nr:hypothetical protein [Streptomyces sp. AA0539]
MKFVLEVDLEAGRMTGDTAAELGRILRYWGGNLHHYALRPGDGSGLYDSGYAEVGSWHVTGRPGEEPGEEPAEAGG